MSPSGSPSSPSSGTHIIERMVKLAIDSLAANAESLTASADRMPALVSSTFRMMVRLSLTVSSSSSRRCFIALGVICPVATSFSMMQPRSAPGKTLNRTSRIRGRSFSSSTVPASTWLS